MLPSVCSASFLVGGVNTLPLAVLLHLNTLSVVDLVLHRDVITSLALLARQRYGDPLVVLGHGSLAYFRILVTRPAPTVRPPSRIANFKPSSIAIGLPN